MRLLPIFFLILCLQSITKADDLRDFEIEGFSIGDSLLDYFNEDLIMKEMSSDTVFVYKDNKFVDIGVGSTNIYPLKKNLEVYEDVGITLKPGDKEYIIYSVDGSIYCENLDTCLSQRKDIESELITFFGSNATHTSFNSPHAFDKSGQSKTYLTTFKFKSQKDVVRIIVTDWSDEITNNYSFDDSLKVEIISAELYNFLSQDIYD